MSSRHHARISTDFFISYTLPDERWAEWIERVLHDAGHTTYAQFLDARPGTHFPSQIDDAVRAAERTIAVISAAYERSAFGSAEWAAAFRQDPIGRKRKLVPVRVEAYQPTGLLASIVYIDLVGVSAVEARHRLLDGLRPGRRPRTVVPPSFPGR